MWGQSSLDGNVHRWHVEDLNPQTLLEHVKFALDTCLRLGRCIQLCLCGVVATPSVELEACLADVLRQSRPTYNALT